MPKYRFEIDMKAFHNGRRGDAMYCKDIDMFMEFVEVVYQLDRPNLIKFFHPYVGTFFVDVETEQIFQAVVTYKPY